MAQFALADELGTLLGRTLDAGEVAQADLLLQLASAAIQSEAHQSLEFVADDEVSLRGSYSGQMWLPERPVVDVTEVTIRNGVGLPLSVPLTTTQFAWDRRGLLNRGPWIGEGVETNAGVPWGGWGGPSASVVVTYSHGFEEIPDDIRGVCLEVAKRALNNPDGGPPIKAEAVEGSISVDYETGAPVGALDLTETEAKIARRYRPVNA